MSELQEKGMLGIKGIKPFPITSFDSINGLPVYGTGIDWKGARGLKYTNTGESEAQYADDALWVLLEGAQGAEGEITMFTLPKLIKTSLMGYEEDENKVLAKTKQSTPFGFIYETTKVLEDGSEDKVLNVIYNATLGAPEEEETTKENTPSLKEYVVPYTAGAITNSAGKTFAKAELQLSVVGEEFYNYAKNNIVIFGEATDVGSEED